LRRMQFESANKGNVTMQIWLGKQYLGQSDHPVNEVRPLPSGGQMSLHEVMSVMDAFLERHPTMRAEMEAINARADSEENEPQLLPLRRQLPGPSN
jgi:hypothetical protein